MVHRCILCNLCSRTADASITFHVFPKDENRRRKWLQAINMAQVAKFAQLCSNHFKSTDFQETIYGQRRIIKKTVIPTIISRETNFDDIDNGVASIEKQCHTEIQMNTQDLKKTLLNKSKESKQLDRIEIEKCSVECNNAAKDNPNSLKRKSMDDEELDIPLKHIKRIKDINVNEVSKNTEEAKIVLEIAMETIQEQQRKIYNLQSHINKLKKRVKSLNVLNKYSG